MMSGLVISVCIRVYAAYKHDLILEDVPAKITVHAVQYFIYTCAFIYNSGQPFVPFMMSGLVISVCIRCI